MWAYNGTLETTEQDLLLQPERPLPPHRYRRFRYETELLQPENIDEVHKQSHVQAETFHQRTHNRLVSQEVWWEHCPMYYHYSENLL